MTAPPLPPVPTAEYVSEKLFVAAIGIRLGCDTYDQIEWMRHHHLDLFNLAVNTALRHDVSDAVRRHILVKAGDELRRIECASVVENELCFDELMDLYTEVCSAPRDH